MTFYMNKTMKSILTLIAFGATALGLAAQPALKIITVDMSKLLEGYYKTEDQAAKLKANEQKAQEELERMARGPRSVALVLRGFDEPTIVQLVMALASRNVPGGATTTLSPAATPARSSMRSPPTSTCASSRASRCASASWPTVPTCRWW